MRKQLGRLCEEHEALASSCSQVTSILSEVKGEVHDQQSGLTAAAAALPPQKQTRIWLWAQKDALDTACQVRALELCGNGCSSEVCVPDTAQSLRKS